MYVFSATHGKTSVENRSFQAQVSVDVFFPIHQYLSIFFELGEVGNGLKELNKKQFIASGEIVATKPPVGHLKGGLFWESHPKNPYPLNPVAILRTQKHPDRHKKGYSPFHWRVQPGILTWRIIPLSKWLITKVSKSPK